MSDPTSVLPTTPEPTTLLPTAPDPTSVLPAGPDPTTLLPATPEPTTLLPTVPDPTSALPTTSDPTTLLPTLPDPTSVLPTTPDPTTLLPTLPDPTSVLPTTPDPTSLLPIAPDPTTLVPAAPDTTTLLATAPDPTTALPAVATPDPASVVPAAPDPTTVGPPAVDPPTLSPATDPPVTAQQGADTAAHAAGTSAASAPPVTDLTVGGGSPPAFEAAAHQFAATQQALEGGHTGLAIGTTVQGGGEPALPALSGGGSHIDVPPLDPNLLRYVGLAGLLALTVQAAARWTNAVSGCGVPTPLALRNFRLLPCLAVSSGERLAHATVSLVSRAPTGPAEKAVVHSGFGRRSASPGSPSHGEAARVPGSRSGASNLFEVVIVAALLAVNFVLISLRDVVRRETRG